MALTEKQRAAAERQAIIERASGINATVSGGSPATLPPLSSIAPTSALNKVRNVDELNRLASLGLTESDITRKGKDIYTNSGITEQALTDRKATPTATPTTTGPVSYADALKSTLASGAKKGANDVLTAESGYDNQLLVAKSALVDAWMGSTLTPDQLRVLSPSQQAAVREGKKDAIGSAIAGINTIIQGRKDLHDEEEAKAEEAEAKALAKAETTFNLYTQHNLWSQLSVEEQTALETTLGLPAGTIAGIAAEQASASDYDYKYSAGLGNSIVETVTDKKTGKLVSTRTIGSTGTGGGSTSTTSETSSTGKLSKDDFTSAYIAQVGEDLFVSPDIDNPEVKAQIDALYQEYVASFAETDTSILKLLSSTDKKKMIAQGLDPSDIEDVRTYFSSQYGEEVKTTTEEEDLSFLD